VPTFGPIALPALVFLLLDYIGACEKEPEVVIDRGEIGLPFTNMSANGMEGYFYVQTLYNIDIGKLCFSAEDSITVSQSATVLSNGPCIGSAVEPHYFV